MSELLRRAYRQLGEEAHDYVDVHAVRRRARKRWMASAITALAAASVVATTAVVGVALLPGPTGAPPMGSPLPQQTVPAGPPSPVRVAPSAATPLPADAPVGAAELIYAPCARDCPPHLLLADGRQHRLPQDPVGHPTRGYTLSPDGRWLGRRDQGGYVVRDLTGTAAHRVDRELDPWVWSPDARWLLLAEHRDGTVGGYVVLDVQSGQTVRHVPRDAAEWLAVGVLPTGDLLMARGEGGAVGGRPVRTATLGLREVDATSGAERRQRTVELGGSVHASESLSGLLVLGPGGTTAVVGVFTANSSGEYTVLSALVHVDVVGGAVLSRVELPRRTDPGTWRLHAVAGDDARLTWTSRAAVEWVAVGLRTAGERVTALLPPEARVVGRGQGRF